MRNRTDQDQARAEVPAEFPAEAIERAAQLEREEIAAMKARAKIRIAVETSARKAAS